MSFTNNQTANWLQLSPAQTPITSPGLTPREKVDDIPALERVKSNTSSASFDPSRRPMPTRCPTTQSTFFNMRGELRAEAALGLRMAGFLSN